MRLAGLVPLALAIALAGCRSKERSAAVAPPPAPTRSAAPPPPPTATPLPRIARRGKNDVTFVVASDTHFGFEGIEPVNERLIDAVNHVAGKAWPAPMTGAVGAPRGLVVTGDLTEWGGDDEWARFVAFYGTRGDAKLSVPVYEMIGNHDKVRGLWVRDRVAERHGGHFYSWQWDDLHLVSLGEAPDDEGLEFLARDLERVDGDVPIVLFFHLALEGPWSTEHWFAEGDYKERLARLVAGRMVLAIFHGHHHARGRYAWRGVDVIKPGAAKHSAHSVAVVHVTDERMDVGWLEFDRREWVTTWGKPLPARR